MPVPADRAQTGWFDAMAEWLDRPEHFDGLVWRRALAYIVDIIIIGLIGWAVWFVLATFALVTFGLAAPLFALMPAIPLAYHTLLIGGTRSATLGMRMFDVEMRAFTGERPDLGRAFLGTVLFYVTMMLTSGLIVLVGVFNKRSRLLHDVLVGLVAVRTSSLSDQQLLLPPSGRNSSGRRHA
jgi:uncharacterized RDD family membrane protein YckC